MQIRKFEGVNIADALRRVKAELGPDAVIFTTRTIKPRGLFGPTRVEVTAAADPQEAPTPEATEATSAEEPVAANTLAALQQELRAMQENVNPREEEHFDTVQAQLDDLRRMLGALGGRRGARDWIADVIACSDLGPEVGHALAIEVRARATREGAKARRDALYGAIHERLSGREYHRARRVLAMVGPTGVGKTTTIAKIAAQARLAEGRRVTLIGLDNYRVGALAQLEEYAELIGVPLLVANGPVELADALVQCSDSELVLIDTAGRNPNDDAHVPGLAAMLATAGRNNVDVHLCIPASTRRSELTRIIERYEALGPDALLFTKLDEAAQLEGMLNACAAVEAPVSWVTTGQRVPEDLEVARADRLAQRLTDCLTAVDGQLPSVAAEIDAIKNEVTTLGVA